MSKASVLLPEPETPVMTLNLPRGMSTSSDLRLCSRALTMRIASSLGDAAPRAALRRSDCSGAAFLGRRWRAEAQRLS